MKRLAPFLFVLLLLGCQRQWEYQTLRVPGDDLYWLRAGKENNMDASAAAAAARGQFTLTLAGSVELQKMGEQGWELVSANIQAGKEPDLLLIFKRRK